MKRIRNIERIMTESGTNHETRTNQERIRKTERIRNLNNRQSRPPYSGNKDPPTVEIKTLPRELGGTVEIKSKFMLDPHGGNMYKQNQQRR